MRIKVQVTSQNKESSGVQYRTRKYICQNQLKAYELVNMVTNEDYWNQESSEICDLLIEKRRLLENEEKVQLELSLGGVTEYSSYHTGTQMLPTY
jgi:hypothetical protein